MLQELKINYSLLQFFLFVFLQQDFLYLVQISCFYFMAFLVQELYTRLFITELYDKAILKTVLSFQVKQIILVYIFCFP